MPAAKRWPVRPFGLSGPSACMPGSWQVKLHAPLADQPAKRSSAQLHAGQPTWIRFLPSFLISLGCRLTLFICGSRRWQQD